ncbi:MAG: serine/threonine protein kinase, partial [Anaerolineales bacterium]|nr:serine/threonine protein kinase [Anaerolineales bacterium]
MSFSESESQNRFLKDGRYRFDPNKDRINFGGEGTIYRAYDQNVNRYVALKMLPSNFASDPKRVERFKREIKTHQLFESHIHVVDFFDQSEEGGRPFFVMRLLEGGSLRDKLSGEPLSIQQAFVIFQQIASAVMAMHHKNYVHLDLKPANILFDVQEKAYLSDFGLALDLNGNLVPSGGTPEYQSP